MTIHESAKQPGNLRGIALVAAVACFLLACGSSLVGTYTAEGGAMSIELKSGGQATFKTAMGETDTCTWKPNGSKVSMTCDNQTLDLTVNSDGSLNAPLFGNFKKSK